MREQRQHAGTCGLSIQPPPARVSPRSHPFGTRQPRSRADGSPTRPPPCPALGAPFGTRGRAFPCQPRTQTRSAAPRDTKSPLSRRRVRASAMRNPASMPSHCHTGVDLQTPFVIHYRLPRAVPWPAPPWSKRRRSRYLPSQPRTRTGVVVTPEVAAPRFPFVVRVPSTSPALWLGAP